jgi:hypothetical protein
MTKFSEYTTFSKPQLLFHLAEVQEELSTLYPEIALTKAQDLKDRLEAWQASRSSSVTGRSDDAKYATTLTTSSLYELESQENSLKEEKYFLLTLLEHGDFT